VATNVFHRAFPLGPPQPELPAETGARLLVGAETRAEGAAREDYADLVVAAARLLEAVGERLRAGDVLITGSVVQVPVALGDEVAADCGALGSVALRIGSPPAMIAGP
jgi:2-keto-4-pentenoate hydratase